MARQPEPFSLTVQDQLELEGWILAIWTSPH